MNWMRNAAVGLVLLALLGASPLFPTEQSQRLAEVFSERVRALEVSFNVPELGLRNHVRTAVALASDEAGTWWLTAPAALELPGHVDATLAEVQLSDSEASLSVRAVVDDFSGTYALLLESQDRAFAPLAVRQLLPMHGLQWAGLLYAAEDGAVRVLPGLQEIEGVHERPNGPAKAFTFRTFERLPRSAVGAPVFVNAFGDFADGSAPGFALAGFVVEPRLPAPSLQLRVKGVQAPFMGKLFPKGIENNQLVTESNQTETTNVTTDGNSAVLINEFDADPPGEDKDSEWVELFNSGEDAVDISNWFIVADFQGQGGNNEGRIRFPPGTEIGPREVLDFQGMGQVLDNEDEVIELRNSSSSVIDSTPSLSDTGDGCWARVPDGSSNWNFRPCTRGELNGS